MIVSLDGGPGKLVFEFQAEEGDELEPSDKFRMGAKRCEFSLPDAISPESIHPDHLGLVVIMLCTPFVHGKLTLPKAISEQFHDSTKVLRRFEVGPINPALEPYYPASDSRPALAFSGGTDSTAALALMPESTVCVFLDRPTLEGSLYDKDAPLQICNNLKEDGRDVYMVRTDLEYLRDPIGFPVDVANSAPAVLLAELLGFNSIAFGTIFEAAYRIGHPRYRDYPRGSHFSRWGSLFSGAGVPLNLVVAGLSEVCTSRLMVEHPYGKYSQSCIRGKWRAPCRNCWKCFRKILLDTIIRGEELSDNLLDELFRIKGAIFSLSKFPIQHENVFTWITSRYSGDHKLMLLMKKRVRGDKLQLEWLERWNQESVEVIHNSCGESVKENIGFIFKKMDVGMLQEMKDWDMRPMLESEKYQKIHEEFCRALAEIS